MTTEPLPLVIETLARVPSSLLVLVKDLSDEQVRLKRDYNEFSMLENICHLRDIEIEGYGVRISRILKENLPALADIDGGRLAIERDYNHQEINAAFDKFRDARLTNVELLRGLDEEQLNREGMLEGVGPVTLHRLLQMMRDHDESHVAEVRVLRERLLKGYLSLPSDNPKN